MILCLLLNFNKPIYDIDLKTNNILLQGRGLECLHGPNFENLYCNFKLKMCENYTRIIRAAGTCLNMVRTVPLEMDLLVPSNRLASLHSYIQNLFSREKVCMFSNWIVSRWYPYAFHKNWLYIGTCKFFQISGFQKHLQKKINLHTQFYSFRPNQKKSVCHDRPSCPPFCRLCTKVAGFFFEISCDYAHTCKACTNS